MSDTAFGYHAVESLIRKEPRRVAALHVQADRQDSRMQALCELSRNQGVSVLSCSKSELDALVTGRHQGVVAVLDPAVGAESAGMMSEADLSEHLSQVAAPLILILDGVTDPHNLGACLRSADAAGATAVIFPKDKSADVNDVARKVASGAAETVPWVRVTNLARTIQSLEAGRRLGDRHRWRGGGDALRAGSERPLCVGVGLRGCGHPPSYQGSL